MSNCIGFFEYQPLSLTQNSRFEKNDIGKRKVASLWVPWVQAGERIVASLRVPVAQAGVKKWSIQKILASLEFFELTISVKDLGPTYPIYHY